MSAVRFGFPGYGPEPSIGYAMRAGPTRLVVADAEDNPGPSVASVPASAAECARRVVDVEPAPTIFIWLPANEGGAGELCRVPEDRSDSDWRLIDEPDASLSDAIAALGDADRAHRSRQPLAAAWEGVVTDIVGDAFVAVMLSIDIGRSEGAAVPGYESEVSFRFDEITPEQRPRLAVGGAFRWSVRAVDVGARRTTTSSIELLHVPEPSGAARRSGDEFARDVLTPAPDGDD
jgi:hypothetical protein